jgi:hypothetical protein
MVQRSPQEADIKRRSHNTWPSGSRRADRGQNDAHFCTPQQSLRLRIDVRLGHVKLTRLDGSSSLQVGRCRGDSERALCGSDHRAMIGAQLATTEVISQDYRPMTASPRLVSFSVFHAVGSLIVDA